MSNINFPSPLPPNIPNPNIGEQPNLNKNIKPNNFNNKKLKISSQKNIFNQDKPLYNALSYIQRAGKFEDKKIYQNLTDDICNWIIKFDPENCLNDEMLKIVAKIIALYPPNYVYKILKTFQKYQPTIYKDIFKTEIFEPYIQDKFYARMNQLNLFIFMEKALSPIRIKRINQTIKSVYNEKVARIQKIN